MAVTELVFPVFKNADLVKEHFENFFPVAIQTFKGAGIVRGILTYIISENGQDVPIYTRELLLLEWPSQDKFSAFIQSPEFAKFAESVKPRLAGQPELKLFDTTEVTPLATDVANGNKFLNVLELRPKDEARNDEVLDQVLSSMRGSKAFSDPVHGSSLNLQQKQVVIIESYPDLEAVKARQAFSVRREFLESVKDIVDVTDLISQVEKGPFQGTRDGRDIRRESQCEAGG